MNRPADMTKDTIHRSQAPLRTHRRARIIVSARQKLIVPANHHANRQNAGQANPAMSAKRGAQRPPGSVSGQAQPTNPHSNPSTKLNPAISRMSASPTPGNATRYPNVNARHPRNLHPS